jgi:hypothetical protein
MAEGAALRGQARRRTAPRPKHTLAVDRFMADKQKLNSLDRFRKQPGRLVLEAHGSCEVPAGCGGAVLRWRNPQTALPVTFYVYTPVPAKFLLDGAALPTARHDLAPGKHVVAFALENVNLAAGLLLFAAVHDPKVYRTLLPAEADEGPLTVVTAEDGTWKYTLDEPSADWGAPSFDDHSLASLVKVPTPQLAPGDPGAYLGRRCTELGAVCLGFPSVADPTPSSWWQRLLGSQQPTAATSIPGNIWIRKVIEVPACRVAVSTRKPS